MRSTLKLSSGPQWGRVVLLGVRAEPLLICRPAFLNVLLPFLPATRHVPLYVYLSAGISTTRGRETRGVALGHVSEIRPARQQRLPPDRLQAKPGRGDAADMGTAVVSSECTTVER